VTAVADVLEFIRRRSGTVAAGSAVVGFALGVLGAYQIAHTPPAPRIILRQATEGDQLGNFDQTPGADGVLILLRNDSTVPVEVINAAFSRTSAAPPLYIAPETVPPGGEVNVFVAIPGTCVFPYPATARPAPPVRILVNAHQPGTPVQSVPVEVVGTFAQIMASCNHPGGRQ
jgi:hypothetical protein